LPEALDATQTTLEMYKQMLSGFKEEVENFGNFPSYYMGLVTSDGSLEHYDGKIRITDKNGNVAAECVDATKYRDFIGEAVEPWSFMKFP
jgi:NAD-reducing hydrogenase large subunit